MAEIVIELKRRNWSDKKIGKELGMDPDEVLRLSQITGLAEMFANHEFSEAWEPDATEDGSGKSIDANSNDVDFLWATLLSREDSESGWIDKTEKMSVFYDDNQQRLGQVKKSRFEKNTWFWYVYKQPMSSGKAHSLLEAKRQVEINWGI
jgi:hypothetical protein